MNPQNISQVEFCRHYGVTARPHYGDFCDYVARMIKEVVDPETQIFYLRIESSWQDVGSNRHAAVRADGTRRDEKGELGADIVWLVRSRTFRGAFWSRIRKRTDSDYYSRAREAFYRRDYPGFLRLAAFITSGYGEIPALRKMRAIAERYATRSSTTG